MEQLALPSWKDLQRWLHAQMRRRAFRQIDAIRFLNGKGIPISAATLSRILTKSDSSGASYNLLHRVVNALNEPLVLVNPLTPARDVMTTPVLRFSPNQLVSAAIEALDLATMDAAPVALRARGKTTWHLVTKEILEECKVTTLGELLPPEPSASLVLATPEEGIGAILRRVPPNWSLILIEQHGRPLGVLSPSDGARLGWEPTSSRSE